MKNLILFIVVALMWQHTNAQEIAADSKGKSIFTYYGFEESRFNFSADDLTVTFGINRLFDSIFYYRSPDTINVLKKRGMVIQLGLLNANKNIDLSELNKFTPGYILRLGYQNNVQAISDNYRGATFSWGFSGRFSIDKFKLYDPATALVTDEKPVTYGLETNLTWFPMQIKGGRLFLMHTNLSLLKTWNDDDMYRFKELDGDIIYNDGSIIAFEDFDGRYGTLIENIDKVRLAISTPFYFGDYITGTSRLAKTVKHISIIPYATVSTTSVSKPLYMTGGFLNFLSKPMDLNKFTAPSSLGIGIDWQKDSEGWSKSTIFLKGSIAIK